MAFSQVKRIYKKHKIEALVRDQEVDVKNLIKKSFAEVSKESIRSFIRHCLNLIID